MIRHVVQIAVLLGTLVVGIVPVTLAQSQLIPVSTGVVATITTLDAHRGLATVQTEAGEVFQLPTEPSWKVGDRVECDRLDNAAGPRLQHCQPW